MAGTAAPETWAAGEAYEGYVGRWSRPVAQALLAWLELPGGLRWLDVGCGTGALTSVILERSRPRALLGVDRSAGFVRHAHAHLARRPGAAFAQGDALALPVATGAFDAVVSGLVLNFVPAPARMVGELARAAAPGGTVALYVWDYAAGMELLRRFWDAARALDPAAAALDEGVRFPICAPGPLVALLEAAGLQEVANHAIAVPTHFRDFDDLWRPFLGRQGPAPGYVTSLPEDRRAALRERLRASLPIEEDGTIQLTARAWVVRGRR